jgi:hypothetical protein
MREVVDYKGKKTLEVEVADGFLHRSEMIAYAPIRWLAWAIRVATGCKWNHCTYAVEGRRRLMLHEAKSRVVGALLYKSLPRHKTKVLHLRPRFSVNKEQFSLEAEEYLGAKYDACALVHQLVYRVSLAFCRGWHRWTGRVINPYWIGPTGAKARIKPVCTEAYATLLRLPNPWLWSAREFVDSRHLFEFLYDELSEQ